MSSVSAWSTAAAVPKYDGARHTRVSRHFCICGADLESWVHCVVHIFYPFWPNGMEGNKGIPAGPKYPPLPDLGLAGKCVPSELLYKLVPSTNIIEKIAFMWTWKIKNFIFSSFYGICKENAIIKGGEKVLRVYRVVDCPYGQWVYRTILTASRSSFQKKEPAL